jgi:hypothetical protein
MLLGGGLMLAPGVASADDSGSGEWDFMIAPYLWASGLDGDVAVRGIPGELNLGFGDIVDVLDGGGLVHFEAHREKWTILADVVYLDLGQELENVPGEVDVENAIAEGAVGYRVKESLDLIFGARYVSVDSRLTTTGPLGVRVEDDQGWIDPVVGVRWIPAMGEVWGLFVRADIGGFGAGSDFAWQFRTGAQRRVSEHVSVSLGYRMMKFDYEDGTGLSRFVYDTYLSGAEIGVGFNF